MGTSLVAKKKRTATIKHKVGLGIVTYNRPDYLEQVLQGVVKHLLGEVDTIWVYDDHSTKDLDKYEEIFDRYSKFMHIKIGEKNKGVGPAKNWLMQKLMDEGCYVIFIGEDDIIPVSKMAIRGYIQASRATGIAHFMFAHHGPGNVDGAVHVEPPVEVYKSCVGAWSFFLKPVLELTGLHDEKFNNAYEHVELTWRHAKAGYTTPWGYFADVQGSDKWLKEIPGSIDNSSIRKSVDWALKTYDSLVYWKSKDPEFPLQHILDDTKKEIDEHSTASTNKK